MLIEDWDEMDCDDEADMTMSLREFIESVYGPLNERIVRAITTKANELGLSVQRRFGLESKKDEVEATNCISTIVKGLQDRNIEFRRASVILIRAALRSLPATAQCLGHFPEELMPAIRSLNTALADESLDVRENALRAIKDALSEVDVPAVKAIAEHALKDSHLRKRGIQIIMVVDENVASAAIPELTEVLEREQDEEVFNLACQALARFKIEAQGALTVLMKAAIQEAKPKMRREALRTIVEIDEKGELLAKQIANQSERERFLDLLRKPEIQGRMLRQHLHVFWGKSSIADGSACATTSHAEINGPEIQQTPVPKKWLIGYAEILDAVDENNNKMTRQKLKVLNKRFDGPIKFGRQGEQPIVDKIKLLEWWNGLEERFAESDQRHRDRRATVENQYEYGRDGTAVPDIGGGVKKRRNSQRK